MRNEIPPITEKVKFLEEQDKINQAVIPRLIEMNDSINNMTIELGKVDTKIAGTESRIQKSIREEIAKIRADLNSCSANLESNKKSLNETNSTY